MERANGLAAYHGGGHPKVGYRRLLAGDPTKAVLPDIRRLIEHYEGTGEVLPLERFPGLARAAT